MPQRFTDGQPSFQFVTPDVRVAKLVQGAMRLPVQLGSVIATDSGGDANLDPGETIRLKMPLVNTDLNPLHAGALNGVTAVLSSSTAGVLVTQASGVYGALSPGSAAINSADYVLTLLPDFVPGTPIELSLNVSAASGTTTLLYTQQTGTPVKTLLFAESFDEVAPGALPAGWLSLHATGENTVPWQTSSTFCGGSNKAFHQNANDGADPSYNSRWEILVSPVVAVPAATDTVEVDFDVCYDTEADPVQRYLAYDGFLLRVADFTPGRSPRVVLAEGFEQEFTTGPIENYPRHLSESTDPFYFGDMSAWAGASPGPLHVHMKLPGMAGSKVRFVFDYTQDAGGTCTSSGGPPRPCGVAFDNFVARGVAFVAPSAVGLVSSSTLSRDASGAVIATVTVTNTGSAPAEDVRIASATLGHAATTTNPLPVLGTIPAGGSRAAVVRFPEATSGALSVIRIQGTYTGGTFGGSLRVTIP
jgi:hypothetical protein